MDLSKKTKKELIEMGTELGITGLSKLKKEDIIKTLVKEGVENNPEEKVKKTTKKATKTKSKDDEKEVKEKKPKSPPKVKLDKKIAKFVGSVDNLEKHKQFFSEKKEEISKEEILSLLNDEIKDFINAADINEVAELSNKVHGVLNVHRYLNSVSKSKWSTKPEDEAIKVIALYAFMSHEKAHEALVKAVNKYHAKLLKPPAAKKTKVVKQAEAPDDDEDEEEIPEKDNEPEYNDSDEEPEVEEEE